MNNWKFEKLKSYCKVESGYSFKTEMFASNGIPILKIANIDEYETKHTKSDDFIPFEKAETYKDFELSEGDIVIAMSGNTTCKMGRVSRNFSPSFLNQRVGKFKIFNDELDYDFLYYLMINESMQRRLWNYATATGQPNLSSYAITKVQIPIPPKPEQRTIASILSKVDEAIAATKNSIAKAERLKKALMQNLLTGKLKPDGTWRKEDEFQETIYGLVAKDWRYCKIQELIKDGMITGVQDGNHGESHPVSAEFVNKGIPFIMASDISSGFIDFTSCKFITFERAEKLRIGFSKKDDVLLSHKASMGFTAIVPDVDPYIMLTPQVTYYRCDKEKLLPEYLHFFFQSYKFQKLFETYSAQTTRNFMGITNQKKLYIFLPNTIEEQEEIIKPIKEVDKTLASKYVKIKKLERLKKALMQNLLTGKVRVKIKETANG